MKRKCFDFYAGKFRVSLGNETKLMGVLNVTPNSFYDGGHYSDPAIAEIRAQQIQDQGAHFLDIGGESSKPGSSPISWKEEVRRISPVLRRIKKWIKIPVSVDTYKTETAKAALDFGALIINDIYGARDLKLRKMIASYKASLVIMHMQNNPKKMQNNPSYSNVLVDVSNFLMKAALKAEEAGIEKKRILLDPGFGFGKSLEHNFILLSKLDQITSLGYPVLVGLSRKSFLGHHLGLDAKNRLSASVAAASVAVERGAHVLRIHDVPEHKQCVSIIDKLNN